ncbi:hypothetical protein ABID65_008496 [Bradyrhizobium sp. S3.9.2]
MPFFNCLAADGALETTELSLAGHAFGTAINRTALAAPLVLSSHAPNMRLELILCQLIRNWIGGREYPRLVPRTRA